MQGAGDTEGIPDLGALPLKLPWTECTPSRPKALGVAGLALPSPVSAPQMWKGISEPVRLLCPGTLKGRLVASRPGREECRRDALR